SLSCSHSYQVVSTSPRPVLVIIMSTTPSDREFITSAGRVYVVFNASYVPPEPPYIPFDANITDRRIPAETISRLDYRSDDNFYLAFVPHDPSYNFHVFVDCLDHMKGHFPLTRDVRGYHISFAVGQRWYDLEQLLQRTIPLMQHYCGAVLPLYFVLQYPSEYGYQQAHQTAQAAQLSAWRSREAFLAVFAYISMLFHMCTRGTSPDALDLRRALAGPLPPAFVDFLCSYPPVSGWCINRRGAFVHPHKSAWEQQWLRTFFPHMVRVGVPLWFPCGAAWESVDTTQLISIKPSIIPSREDIRAISAAAPHSSGSVDVSSSDAQEEQLYKHTAPWKAERLERLRTEHLYPPSLTRSHQLRGESWKQFMDRRAGMCRSEEKKESDGEKQARLQRKANFDGPSGQVMPSKKSHGCNMFYWEKVDGRTDGYRLRTLLKKNEWEDYWDDRHGQRIYNEYFNEWDICTEFGDDDKRYDEDEELDEFYGNVTWLGKSAAVPPDVDAPSTSDTPMDVDAPSTSDAPSTFDVPSTFDAPSTPDAPTNVSHIPANEIPSAGSSAGGPAPPIASSENLVASLITHDDEPDTSTMLQCVNTLESVLRHRYGVIADRYSQDEEGKQPKSVTVLAALGFHKKDVADEHFLNGRSPC
ncbi:hypothetical protein EUX98_g9685, partial [Antrodiella citrinella]